MALLDQARSLSGGDAPRLAMPERSLLYHMPPIGIGTPLCESLTSYICRLAKAYLVTPATLFHWALAATDTAFAIATLNGSDPRDKIRGAYLWNGVGPVARALVDMFAYLTRRPDLELTTLIRYEPFINTTALRRRHRAWCPLCLEAFKESGAPVYEPLAWTLNPVTACPTHKIPLVCACPFGCRNMTAMARTTAPGFCYRCGGWLGQQSSGTPRVAPNDHELSISKMVMDMIAETAPIHPRIESKAMIQQCVHIWFDGNLASFAKRIGKNKTTVWTWLNTETSIPLTEIARICLVFQISILDFFRGDPDIWHPPLETMLLANSGPPRPRTTKRVDWEPIERYLSEALSGRIAPAPSVAAIAKRFEVDPSYLRCRYPDICQQISQRFRDVRKAACEARWATEESLMRRAMAELIEMGITPTARLVAKHLNQKDINRKDPRRRQIYDKLFNELKGGGRF